jgi:hypothetical protein
VAAYQYWHWCVGGRLLALVRVPRPEDFKREFGSVEVDPDQVRDWAIANGRMERNEEDFHRQCRKDIVQVIREERITDPQNRVVSKMIALRIKGDKSQKSLWIDVHEAKPKRMRVALSQQRRSIEAWCRKHAATTDSWNDNNPFGAQINRSDYDFNKCLNERQMPLEYPDDKPEADEDD